MFFLYRKYSQGGEPLARTNYKFQKRQKELARQKKKEQKKQNKEDKKAAQEIAADPNQSEEAEVEKDPTKDAVENP